MQGGSMENSIHAEKAFVSWFLCQSEQSLAARDSFGMWISDSLYTIFLEDFVVPNLSTFSFGSFGSILTGHETFQWSMYQCLALAVMLVYLMCSTSKYILRTFVCFLWDYTSPRWDVVKQKWRRSARSEVCWRLALFNKWIFSISWHSEQRRLQSWKQLRKRVGWSVLLIYQMLHLRSGQMSSEI